MKKLLAILLIFSWIAGNSQTASVPDHDHFALGHVFMAVYGDSAANRTTASLFTDASPLRFNTTYGNRNMNPQLINGFRDYGPRPTVTTTTISSIGETTASGGGNVTSDGGSSVTARGVCWGTSVDPEVTGSHTTDGSGTGSFSSSLTGLSGGTLYHVRAYATNSRGPAYGADVYFTTTSSCTRPEGLQTYIVYSTYNGSTITSGNICSTEPLLLGGVGYAEASTLADGNDIYSGIGSTNCTKYPDGYYYMTTYPSKWIKSSFYVSGGKVYNAYCSGCAVYVVDIFPSFGNVDVNSAYVRCNGTYVFDFVLDSEDMYGGTVNAVIMDQYSMYIGEEVISGSWSGGHFTATGTLSTTVQDADRVAIYITYP